MGAKAVIRMPGEGKEITLAGRPMTFLVTGEDTKHPCWLVAGVGDVVRHARWNEDECSGLGADQLAAYLPLAFALKHEEGFFLSTVNVEAGGKSGWQGPIEHGRVLTTASPPGHEHYFEELVRLVTRDGAADASAIAELRSRHDTEQLSAPKFS